MLEDASADLKLPKKKEKADAIHSGIESNFLIKRVYDVQTKPLIAKVPEVLPVERPRIMIPPPSVVKFI